MAGKSMHVWVENSGICFLQSFCAEGKSMNLSIESGSFGQDVSGRTIWFLRGLCATGLGISAYLAWTALQMGEVFGCGGGGSVFFAADGSVGGGGGGCNLVVGGSVSTSFGHMETFPSATNVASSGVHAAAKRTWTPA
jgi:hypothetical protein